MSNWKRLTPELISEIAARTPENDVCTSLKLVDSETAAVLRERYRTVTLGPKPEDDDVDKSSAHKPWPGPAFVAHWGRPEPWRALTLRQRQRLLCLAANSGHVASLDAALANSGTALLWEVLAAAAASGSAAACARLLHGGCSFGVRALVSAARSGDLQVLQLLLDRACAGSNSRQAALMVAASGAGAGGHDHMFEWLQRDQGYSPGVRDVEEAARHGHVELFERLLPPLLERHAPPVEVQEGGGEDPAAEAQVPPYERRRRGVRWQLLAAVARGCPLEVLQRHYDALWGWQRRRAAAPTAELGNEFEGTDVGRDFAASALLSSAVGSSVDWAAKLGFLLSRWGVRVTGQLLREERGNGLSLDGTSQQPDYLHRLRHMYAAVPGCAAAINRQAAQCAAARGRADALVYLLDECGLRLTADDEGIERGVGDMFGGDAALCHTAVLQALQARGWVFTAAHAARAARGAGVRLLEALRGRGAPVDLAAVAVGGSEEGLEWAAAQLRTERDEPLQPLSPDQAMQVFNAGNTAALGWLRARGLLPQEGWLPSIQDVCLRLRAYTFWKLQLVLQLGNAAADQAVGQLGDAQAAAAGVALQEVTQAALKDIDRTGGVLVLFDAPAVEHQYSWLARQLL
eukprot:XP_001703314.1 predicted protein [Chlamydomonas reinhardtii]